MAVEVRYFPARRGKEVNAGQSRNGTARLVGLSQRKAVEVQAGWVCVRHGGFRQRMAVNAWQSRSGPDGHVGVW